MDAIRTSIVHSAARNAADAPWGTLGDITRQAAVLLNLSETRTKTLICKAMRDLGLVKKDRKRRSDAGQSSITEAELLLISGSMMHDLRVGKWMLSCQDAIDMLYDDGTIKTRLSADHVSRLLRERGMHPEQLTRPAPSIRMRTEHINAVWEIDASVCVLYKTPKGELLLLEEGVHYKNKPENLVRVMDQLLVRFVGTEHASGSIGGRFYLGGESVENALDFLMWLMTQRTSHDGQSMPFHGVPFMLYTDQGPAFKSAAFDNFCRVMDIRHVRHAPRNSQATGSVENAQNLFERGLESRLRFLDPMTITRDKLNALGELWMHSYNGTRKHSRHGMTRYAAWATIGTEHLRIAPSMEIMRALPASMAQTRTVTGDMRVSFALKGQGSQDYDLRYVPGISPKDKVYVTVNPFDVPNVRVGAIDRETGEIVWHQVQPLPKGWMGYDATAPVLGSGFKSLPMTPAQEVRQAIDAQAYAKDGKAATPAQVEEAKRTKATPYLGQFDPLADIKAKAASLPTYMQRTGTAHQAGAPTVEAVRVSVAEACKRIRAGLGRQGQGDLYDPGTYSWLSERYGSDGVPEDVIKTMVAARREAPAAPGAPTGLRAVGGSR